MSNDELERLGRLRERQIRARDPKAKERKTAAKVTKRRRKLRRSKGSFLYMLKDMMGDMSYKLRGALIGAAIGTVVSIVLAAVLDDVTMVAILGLAATLILGIMGMIIGNIFDWRTEVTDEFKDL